MQPLAYSASEPSNGVIYITFETGLATAAQMEAASKVADKGNILIKSEPGKAKQDGD